MKKDFKKRRRSVIAVASVASVVTSPITYIVGGRLLLGWDQHFWGEGVLNGPMPIQFLAPLTLLHLAVIALLITILPMELRDPAKDS